MPKMATSTKDGESDVVPSYNKIKANLTAQRGLNHEITEPLGPKPPCSRKRKVWKPKPNPNPENLRKIKDIQWASNRQVMGN